MTVILDTNIILDALQERSPFDVDAKEILKRGQCGSEYTCLFTANAAADIFYLYRKVRGEMIAKSALDFLFNNYGVVTITHNDCKTALSIPVNDFEDALVVVCARNINADYIITRDEEFLRITSPVKIINPKDFISIIRR